MRVCVSHIIDVKYESVLRQPISYLWKTVVSMTDCLWILLPLYLKIRWYMCRYKQFCFTIYLNVWGAYWDKYGIYSIIRHIFFLKNFFRLFTGCSNCIKQTVRGHLIRHSRKLQHCYQSSVNLVLFLFFFFQGYCFHS